MMPRILMTGVAVVAAAAAAAGQATAPPDPRAFRFERAVQPGDRGPSRLALDVPAVAGGLPFSLVGRRAAGGLGDLRLYDAAGREVPYLLITPADAEPLWIAGRILPVAAAKETSGFEVDLGRAAAIDRLRIDGLPAPFLKRVRLEGSGDRSRWTLLVGEGTLFDLPDDRLRRLDLDFAPGSYRYLRVTWDDASSARLSPPRAGAAREVHGGAPAEPLRASLPFERRASEPGRSRYRVKLPGARLPLVAIDLSTSGGNVLREARVTEARLSGGAVVPVVLGSATLRRAVRGDLAAAELRIAIEPPAEPQLELTIDDGSNPPLELTSLEAVFAELPWVYFETADGGPLVARYGRADLAPPRYDLEAARDTVASLRAATATFGPVREATPATTVSASSPTPATGAAIDVRSFAFSREIPGGPPGLQAVALDAAVLAHASHRDLRDIRIATAAGVQIPYLVEKLDEPLPVPLPPLEPTAPPRGAAVANPRMAGTRSYYRLRLPFESLPRARLVLETSARVFERELIVMSEPRQSDARRSSVTRSIAGRRWSHDDPETPAPPLMIEIDPPDSREMMVIVDEGDNQALPLLPPRLLLPAYRLRFFRETDAPSLLLYGQGNLAAPRYDLALLAPRLIGAPAREIGPGPEGTAPPPATNTMPPALFWAVLVLSVVVLLLIVARLVRQKT